MAHLLTLFTAILLLGYSLNVNTSYSYGNDMNELPEIQEKIIFRVKGFCQSGYVYSERHGCRKIQIKYGW